MGVSRSSRRTSPGIFAGSSLFLMMIWLSICTDISSATKWSNICTVGETYTERSFLPPAGDRKLCTDWCEKECSAVGSTVTKNPSLNDGDRNIALHCQCCCSKPETSSPSLPPKPSPAGSFSHTDIGPLCASEQRYQEIKRTTGTDCVRNPQCENKCNGIGLTSAGSQCVGAMADDGVYVWIEQCCCRSIPPSPPPPPPSPPPPSPSPPPPSPPPPPPSPPPPSPPPPPPPSPPTGSFCGCCNTDINTQISVKSGGKVSVSQ